MSQFKSQLSFRYQIQQVLGEGLNSVVYKAIRVDSKYNMSQTVAIKVLKSQTLVDLWRNEIDRLAALNSPFCAKLMGWDIFDSAPALILDWIDGVSLADLLKCETLSAEELDEITFQAVAGLFDLQRNQLVHGDLSPNNIMIDTSGRVKLIDFGILKPEQGLLLTPEYAAPSILRGKAPTFHTDLCSLGRCRDKAERLFGRSTSALTQALLSNDTNALGTSRRMYSRRTQALLAQKVKSIQHKQAVLNTPTQNQKKKSSRLLALPKQLKAAALVGLFLTSFKSDAGTAMVLPFANISIRTLKWVKLNINGKNMGYAPLNIQVPANRQLNISWEMHQAAGSMALTLSRGQNMVLIDSHSNSSSATFY